MLSNSLENLQKLQQRKTVNSKNIMAKKQLMATDESVTGDSTIKYIQQQSYDLLKLSIYEKGKLQPKFRSTFCGGGRLKQ